MNQEPTKMKRITELFCLSLILLMTNCQVEEDVAKPKLTTNREELFFKDAPNSKQSRNEGNSIEPFLKNENEETQFLQKLSDQKGIPIWKNSITFMNKSLKNKNSGASKTIIPLSDNNKNLSSLLFVESNLNEKTTIYTITNEELFKIVSNPKIPKETRETILIQFLYFDNLSFGQREYSNIPIDLFSNIKAKKGKNYKQFKIKINDTQKTSPTARQVSDICVTFYHCSGCMASCDHCSLCQTERCYSFGGVSDPTNYGEPVDGGSSDGYSDGGGGGSSGGSSSSSTPWYLMNPDIDIYTYNTKIRSLFKNLTEFNVVLQREQLDYLNSNTVILNDLSALLVNNTQEKSEFTNNVISALNDGAIKTYKEFVMTMVNFKYSLKSPCNVDLSKVTPDPTLPNNDLKIKFKCVYDKLIESPRFKELFLGTFGENMRPNVIFEIANVPNNANGNTIPDQYNPLNNKIIINTDLLQTGNNMAIAKTIIHECIHAYLNVKLCDPSIGVSIPALSNMDVYNCINQYYNNFSAGQNQHNFIYNFMLPTMKTVLSQVKDSLVSQSNNATMQALTMHIPYNTSAGTSFNWDDFYQNLSLSGLQDCSFFKSEIGTFNPDKTPLTIIDQTKMQSYNQYNTYGENNLQKTCN